MATTSLIALDTNIFIYALEANPEYGNKAAEALHYAQDKGFASSIVYLELLSSLVFRDDKLRRLALGFLDEQKLVYVEPTINIMIAAAQLRAINLTRIDLGDAIHLASAIHAGADTFITNDQDLVKLKISNLKIVGLGWL